MYNKILDVFITVVDCGSFTKASKKLFISVTAIMKQINVLEDTLNLKLLNRTSKGISLTPAGKKIYKESKYIIDYSNKVLDNIKNFENTEELELRVGTSILNPCTPLMNIWYKVSSKYPEFKMKIIPFNDDNKTILTTLENLGNNIDLIVTVCDSQFLLKKYNFYHLGYTHFCIALPRNHRLTSKKEITLEDLQNETIMIRKDEDGCINRQLRNDIEHSNLNITIIDAPYFFDTDTFNTVVQSGIPLITLDYWNNVHPAITNVSLVSNYKIPYGILYSKKTTKSLQKFFEVIDNANQEN